LQRSDQCTEMSAQAPITDEQWLELHRDQLVEENVPAEVHAVVAKKMNREVFDVDKAFALQDGGTRVITATPKHGDAWVADHVLVFCAPTDAKEALKQYPRLVGRFRATAKCRAEDVLERGVWRYAQSLPRYAKGPPIWCVEDEFGNGFAREVGSPTVGTAHITCRKTNDTFAIYWPATDLPLGGAPWRDPFPRLPPGGRRDAVLAASAHCWQSVKATERWRHAYDAFHAQDTSAMTDETKLTYVQPPAAAPLKVWTDVAWTAEVSDPRVQFVEDINIADAVFAHSGGGKYASQVTKHQLVSWFAYEAALIKKDHLASTLRRAGLGYLAPLTFDVETELDALLGFLAATNAHVILKPYDLGRSIGHSVTKFIPQVLAYAGCGGYVAQRYVERPHALPTDKRGRKYDVRVVALLRSAAPLELYAHDHVYIRCANKRHDLDSLDDVEVALTAMHLVERKADYPTTERFIEAFDLENPGRPWASVMVDIRAALRRAFAACASLHAGFAASTNSRAAYGCDFVLDADLNPLLLEVTFAPAPLWSSKDMPARVNGVADDLFRALYFGETDRVTRC